MRKIQFFRSCDTHKKLTFFYFTSSSTLIFPHAEHKRLNQLPGWNAGNTQINVSFSEYATF